MTGAQTLVARAALGTAGALLGIVLTRARGLLQLPQQLFDRTVCILFVLSRLGLFFLVFGLLHLAPRGDVPGFYLPQAQEILRHHLPYRDFPSSYAPLHAVLDAGFVALRNTPLSIIFAAVLAEMLVLPLWLRAGRAFVREEVLRTAALLYLASPISLQFVTVDGQDNVVIAAFMALSLVLVLRGRYLLSGASLGLTATAIKFLPLLFAPAFVVALPRRFRWAAGAGLVLAAVYGGSLLLHLPIMQPLTAEGQMRSAGNLPYLVESLAGVAIPAWQSSLVLLAVLAALLLRIAEACRGASQAERMRALSFGMCALTLALLLFAKKSWPPYLMLSLFPLCLTVAEQKRRIFILVFSVFSIVAVTEQSFWSSLLLEAPSFKFHQALLAGSRNAWLFFVLHLLLLVGYAWLLHAAIKRIRSAAPGASIETGPVDRGAA